MEIMRPPTNSLDKKIIKEIKILQKQINPPKTTLKKNFPSIRISEIYTSLYKEAFPLILRQTRFKFLDKINKEADDIIIKRFLKTSNNIMQISESKEKIIKKYETDYKFLYLEYKNFLRNKKNYNYFSHFRKHCGKTEKYGYHYCDNNKISKFIEIKKNGEVSYIICEGCKLCYSVDFILMFCSNCNRKYFSNKLKETEDENILPATWGRYHCNFLINEIMKCIKCKSVLYLNLKTGYLQCLNKKCKFVSKPEDIAWTCITCGKEFISYAKIYNPLDFQVLNRSIKFALVKQIKAAPKKLPCNCTKDSSKLTFYHKEECKGILLKGILMENAIIVCSKCNAINFEDKFSWICPLCGIKFHLHSVIGTKPFATKKYVINKSFNRSLPMNESRYNLIKNLKDIDILNESKDIGNNTNRSSMKYGNNIGTNINSKIINYKKYLSPSNKNYMLNKNQNQIPGYTKKILITNFMQYKNNNSNSNSKKKKYRTLIDILRKRQTSEPGKNNKNENIELNKTTVFQAKNKLKIFPVPKRIDNSFKQPNNIKDSYISINTNKNYNMSEIQTSEENKGTYKGILDTTDNSTFKASSINEPNKNIYNNKNYKNNNINKNIITGYKAWDSKGKFNINNTKSNNLFNLYKNNSNRLKILQLKGEAPNPNPYLYANNNKNTIKRSLLKEKENNDFLYSDKTQNDIPSPFEDKSKDKYSSPFSPFLSNETYSNKNSQTSSDTEEEEEKNDIIKGNVINPSKRKNHRESLNLHGNFMRQSILISQEKLNNLAKKTNIPSFNESDYNFICPIGEGTNGTVYLVEHNETLEQYALKKIICRDYIELIKQKEELELIFSVKHKNILSLYGIQFKYLDETTSSILVLMELAKSDWNKEIKKRFLAKKYYKENELINLLKQIIKGFLFLQDKNIVHRDIKPQNILLFPQNIYKIADFGEAKFIKNIKEQSTLKGSELFMSPLLYKGYKWNQKNVLHNPFKSDVFSLGYCLIYAMCLNLNALDALRELTTMRSITNCINKFLIPNTFSKKLINLVYKMIEPNEDLRYDFEDLSNELNNF